MGIEGFGGEFIGEYGSCTLFFWGQDVLLVG